MTESAVTPTQGASAAMTFGRRIGTVAVLFLVARMVSQMLHAANVLVLAYRLVPTSETVAQVAIGYGIACAVIFGALLVLLRAQRCVAANRSHWLASVPEARLIAGLIVLLIASRFIPRIAWDSSLFGNLNQTPGPAFGYAMRGLGSALAVAACYIWIWWCNSPPRVERLVVVAALAWFGFEFLLDMVDLVTPALSVMLTRAYESGWTISLPGSDAYAHITGRAWIWNVGAKSVLRSLWSWLTYVIVPIPIAAVIATMLYLVLNREKSAPKH